MNTDNPETNKAADRLIATLKEYHSRIHGKTLEAKDILKEVQEVIKRRIK